MNDVFSLIRTMAHSLGSMDQKCHAMHVFQYEENFVYEESSFLYLVKIF